MDKFIVYGGKPLAGEVRISGSKNASLPLMAASILAKGQSVIHNVPRLEDTKTMLALLAHLGARIHWESESSVLINTDDIFHSEAPYEIVRKMRATFWVLAPLLARFGEARVSLPGGCAIGTRPVDLHLRGLELLGVEIQLEDGYVEARAPGGLKGAHIALDMPSVGATHQLMMAASLAEGTSIIDNAAREPEIQELAQVLCCMGARIVGAGESRIYIEGVRSLNAVEHTVSSDRIESATFIAMAAITQGDMLIRGVNAQHLNAVVEQFQKTGCQIDFLNPYGMKETTDIRVKGPRMLQAMDLQTAPYPAFPSDMQAQYMACMAVAQGASCVEEMLYENRFMQALELKRMGAQIDVQGRCAKIQGVSTLQGAIVMATDLRASASLILAGLRAEGRTEVLRVYHLDRGYAMLEEKIQNLGGNVRRIKQEAVDLAA